MAFSVSGLSDFTQKATEFLLEGILYSEDFSRFDIQTGVSYKEYINYLDTAPVIQAGVCDLDASGTTVFTEKTIETVPMSVKDKWCLNDLRKKDIKGEVGTGKGNMTNDLRVPLVKDEIDKIKQKIDKVVWQGNTGSGDLVTGILTEATADSDVIDVTGASGATVTISNIDEEITRMILAVPQDMWSRGKMVIHVSLAYYNLYKQNRINSNMYHDNMSGIGLLSMPVFGWENMVEIVGEPGMNTSTQMILTWDHNIIYAVDELKEVASAELYFNPLDKNVYFLSEWKMSGLTYKFGTEIVLYSLHS